MKRILITLVALFVCLAGVAFTEVGDFRIDRVTDQSVEITLGESADSLSREEIFEIAELAADEAETDISVVHLGDKRLDVPEDGIQSDELPGWTFAGTFIQPDGTRIEGSGEPDHCIPETACISGALAGRPEIFAKLIGPRPSGFCHVQITRFTPAEVEVVVWPVGHHEQVMVWMRATNLRERNPTVIGVIVNETFLPFGNGECVSDGSEPPVGSGDASIVWGWPSCCPGGESGGCILMDYEYDPDTPETAVAYHGFRATGTGRASITAQTESRQLTESDQFWVEAGAEYVLRIPVGETGDVADPFVDDQLTLTSPAASGTYVQGYSTEWYAIYGLELDRCSD